VSRPERQKQSKFRSFPDARVFARSLNLPSSEAWVEFCASGSRPSDIPSNPPVTYHTYWQGWRDWLGTGQARNARSARYKFRPFEEARAFARNLGFSGRSNWRSYVAGPERPPDIPTNPGAAYRSQWKGWGDWLGTGNTKNSFLSFETARDITRGFGFQKMAEYHSAVRRGLLPHGVPKDPRIAYRTSGWQSWGDWLGIQRQSTIEKGRIKRPFNDAVDFAHSQRLRSKNDWFLWARSGDRPDDIPVNPAYSYEEWKGWAHFLGTKNKRAGEVVYRDFLAAREWARSRGLQSQAEWKALAATGRLPADIPARPGHVYRDKGWTTIGDWLGKGDRHSKNRQWRNFAAARDYVRSLGLRSWPQFTSLGRAGNLPADIPTEPRRVYRTSGWKSRGDWLGTNTIASTKREFLEFEKAREFVRALGFQSKTEYETWARSNERPSEIPALPSRTYATTGWLGWGDWVGIHNRWSKTSILAFVSSLVPLLNRFQPSEIYAILRQNGCLNAVDSLDESSPLKQLVQSALHQDKEDFERLLCDLRFEKLDEDETLTSSDVLENDEVSGTIFSLKEEDEVRLPDLSPAEILSGLDELERSVILSDTETIEFLIAKAVGRLWSRVLRTETFDQDLAELRCQNTGSYGSRVRERFLAQFNGASVLPIPEGYSFRKNDEQLQPNLMQRLIAYRVGADRRVGNWSGTGAGKTLGAILASRALGSKLTVIVALNNAMLDLKSGWAAEILNAFPASHVIIKERGRLTLDAAKPNYLLLNYEAFQQQDSQSLVKGLIQNHKIDFIVLDEVHSAKSRGQVESKRRQLISYLLAETAKSNPDIRVLAMSATPVINSLDEAISLLEMVTGRKYLDLDRRPKVSSALAIHEQLVIHGVRYLPRYEMELHERPVEILGAELADRLQSVGKGQVLAIETILTEAKLDTVAELAKPGTLIFSQFVESIFPMIHKRLSRNGFRVGTFNGEDKSGLEAFRRREIDVLVGSSALGTGVDGLQYVCNRLIVMCLPWTSAGYEQLLGRVYRQGSAFHDVEVFIPQVVLRNGADEWSWDRQRLARIRYKKTLADAAVDGIVPEAKLASPELMLEEAKKALAAWIERLTKGESREISRPILRVPLPPETVKDGTRRFGDFSAMNARINSSNSDTTHLRFQQNPEEWFLYHTLYREARSTWPEVPFKVLAEWLKRRPDWVVGDFGCGEAELARLVPNKVYSFDHVAVNESVIVCDMTATGLADQTLDVAVFSLSLMGLNYQDYLREAYRLLRHGGWLKVAEPAARWGEAKLGELLSAIASCGFSMVGQPNHRDRFIYLDAIKS
jgi:superfamily II DNA or RNA helicase